MKAELALDWSLDPTLDGHHLMGSCSSTWRGHNSMRHMGVFLQHPKPQQQNRFPRVYRGFSSVLTHRAHGAYAHPFVIDAKIFLYILLAIIHIGTDSYYSSTSRLYLTVPDLHKCIRRVGPCSRELIYNQFENCDMEIEARNSVQIWILH